MSERSAQAELMAKKRAAERDIEIPLVANPQRRLHAEQGPYEFLETYFPERFFDEWTDDRRLMVEQIRYRARYGGDKAIAAPRGEGKTTLAECELGIDAICIGLLKFPLIVAATGPDAERILSNIKAEYEFNEILREDYPEICAPIAALEGAPQRANMQTYRGERTRIKWSGNYIVMPTVKLVWCPLCYSEGQWMPRKKTWQCSKCRHQYEEYQSKSSGSIIEAKGLDGAIRGLRRGSQRPDFVLIDDAETRESAKSYTQIEQREKTIDQDIAGLGGGRRPVARLLLCTIMNTMCLSAKYTDRHQKPSWDGDRLALVRRWPERKDLWEKYIELRQNGMQEEPPDKLGRVAHQFYSDNREEMDRGCVVSNENRFSNDILEDGTPRELSTIQHVHNAAADKGWDYVFNELQNDPQEESTEDVRQLSVGIVTGTHSAYRGRLNGLAPGTCPTGTRHVTAFVDVQHDRLYFEVVAWMKGRQRAIIDYGDYGADIGQNLSIGEATIQRIVSLSHMWKNVPYAASEGEPRTPEVVLVDSGDGAVTTSVYSACQMCGFLPSKGSSRVSKPKDDRSNTGPDAWHATKIRHEKGRVNLITFHTEPFRHRSRDSWLLEPGDGIQGSVFLHGDNPTVHRVFGEHMSVQFIREHDEKKGWREDWLEPRRHDLWDCDYGSFVALSVKLFAARWVLSRSVDGNSQKWSEIARGKQNVR